MSSVHSSLLISARARTDIKAKVRNYTLAPMCHASCYKRWIGYRRGLFWLILSVSDRTLTVFIMPQSARHGCNFTRFFHFPIWGYSLHTPYIRPTYPLHTPYIRPIWSYVLSPKIVVTSASQNGLRIPVIGVSLILHFGKECGRCQQDLYSSVQKKHMFHSRKDY